MSLTMQLKVGDHNRQRTVRRIPNRYGNLPGYRQAKATKTTEAGILARAPEITYVGSSHELLGVQSVRPTGSCVGVRIGK